MNRQRKIIVTVTYNELGSIIDTKAEPYEEPTADVRENVRGEWTEKYYESNETGETVFHGMIMCSVVDTFRKLDGCLISARTAAQI